MRRAAFLGLLLALGCDRGADPAPAPVPTPAAAAAAPPRVTASHPIPVVAVPPPPAPPPGRPEPEPAGPRPDALLETPPGEHALPGAAFLGPLDRARDGVRLERLATAPIVDVVRNKGGATITLRVRFADGARAAFKPEQRHSASNYRAEIAAYHIDRVLGLGRTAPVLGRSIDARRVRQFLEHAETDASWLERFDREVVVRDGKLRGALIAWHEKRLVPAAPPHAWTRALSDAGAGTLPAERAAEWTDLLAFDYLIDNTDRWSGGNVLALGDQGPLVFLDNAAGFMRSAGAAPEDSPLAPVCRFRRQTVETLRAGADGRLVRHLRRTLIGDPLGSPLTNRELRELESRLAKLLVHIDGCITAHGAERVLSL